MDEPEIHALLAPFVDREQLSSEHLAMLKAASELYARRGVLTDRYALALHRACSNRGACWSRRLPTGSRPDHACVHGNGEDGSIYWPYLGPDYRPGGVCVVVLNLHHRGEDWWPLTEEYVVANGQLRSLKEGRWRDKRSPFAYRSTAAAWLIERQTSTDAHLRMPVPNELVATFQRIARLQTVKCSPLRPRSEPTREMARRCPATFLHDELAILRPGSIIVLGADARRAIEAAGIVRWTEQTVGFRRGEAFTSSRREERTIPTFALRHPNARGKQWPQSYDALCQSLAREPIA